MLNDMPWEQSSIRITMDNVWFSVLTVNVRVTLAL